LIFSLDIGLTPLKLRLPYL